MKKVLSLILALVMAASLGLPAFADDEVAAEESYNTQVEYVGKGEEAYTLTVPAELVPTEGQNSGDVILSGTWNSTRQITVSADTKVTLSTKFGDSKELAVTFAGIVLPGSNTEAVSKTEPVSVETMTALFGDWSGTFYYNVEAGDAKKFELDDTFANNTWEAIIYACKNNKVPESWAVGDTKTMSIDDADYAVAILDKNHDTYADGSGTAPLSFGVTSCVGRGKMNDARTTVGGWTESQMRTQTLPALEQTMPAEVQAALKEVTKLSSAGNGASNLVTTKDKLFLFSQQEVCNATTSTYNAAGSAEGTVYSYFTTANNRLMYWQENSANYHWWLRSVSSDTSFTYIRSDGNTNSMPASYEYGIVFGFCF